MKVRNLNEAPTSTIAGVFQPNEVKEVPDDIGKLLLHHGFEEVESTAKKEEEKSMERRKEVEFK